MDYPGSNGENTLGALEKATYSKKLVRAVPDSNPIKFKKLRNILKSKNTMLLDK